MEGREGKNCVIKGQSAMVTVASCQHSGSSTSFIHVVMPPAILAKIVGLTDTSGKKASVGT